MTEITQHTVIAAILIVVLIPIWLILHEGLHALVAKCYGYKVVSLKLWPHRHGADFHFGCLEFIGDNRVLISIAPYLFDVIVFSALSVIIFFVGPLVKVLIVTIMCAPMIDTMLVVQARYRRNQGDLSQWHWGWALPFFYLLFLYIAFLTFQVSSIVDTLTSL